MQGSCGAHSTHHPLDHVVAPLGKVCSALQEPSSPHTHRLGPLSPSVACPLHGDQHMESGEVGGHPNSEAGQLEGGHGCNLGPEAHQSCHHRTGPLGASGSAGACGIHLQN